MYACQNGDKQLLIYFLDNKNCRLDLKSNSGRDALKILVDSEFYELADYVR